MVAVVTQVLSVVPPLVDSNRNFVYCVLIIYRFIVLVQVHFAFVEMRHTLLLTRPVVLRRRRYFLLLPHDLIL